MKSADKLCSFFGITETKGSVRQQVYFLKLLKGAILKTRFVFKYIRTKYKFQFIKILVDKKMPFFHEYHGMLFFP